MEIKKFTLNKYIVRIVYSLSILQFFILLMMFVNIGIIYAIFYMVGGLIWLRIQYVAFSKLIDYLDG